MATSSITSPVEVSGLRVSGVAGDPTQGPLKTLYGNKFSKNIFQFPSDLGERNRGHVITFTVRKQQENNERNQIEASALQTLGKSVTESGSVIFNAAVNAFREQKITREELNQKLQELEAQGQIAKGAVQTLAGLFSVRPVTVEGDTVALYVPDAVNVQYAASYENVSLTSALGKPLFLTQGVSSLIDAYRSGSGFTGTSVNLVNDPFLRTFFLSGIDRKIGTNLTPFGLSSLGYAQNPQLQVLFSNVGFRQFQFYFVLAPKNQAEAAAIQNIVKTLKYAAAPEFQEGVLTNSMFMKVPDTFQIKFLFNGEENLNVNRIGECVLESIDVDYSPNGWSTFNDGSAVQAVLTLQFKEIFIIDKNRINEGY